MVSTFGTYRLDRQAQVLDGPRLGFGRLRCQPPLPLREVTIDYGLTDIVAGSYDAGIRIGEQVAKDIIAVPSGPEMRAVVVGSPLVLRPAPRAGGAAGSPRPELHKPAPSDLRRTVGPGIREGRPQAEGTGGRTTRVQQHWADPERLLGRTGCRLSAPGSGRDTPSQGSACPGPRRLVPLVFKVSSTTRAVGNPRQPSTFSSRPFAYEADGIDRLGRVHLSRSLSIIMVGFRCDTRGSRRAALSLMLTACLRRSERRCFMRDFRSPSNRAGGRHSASAFRLSGLCHVSLRHSGIRNNFCLREWAEMRTSASLRLPPATGPSQIHPVRSEAATEADARKRSIRCRPGQ